MYGDILWVISNDVTLNCEYYYQEEKDLADYQDELEESVVQVKFKDFINNAYADGDQSYSCDCDYQKQELVGDGEDDEDDEEGVTDDIRKIIINGEKKKQIKMIQQQQDYDEDEETNDVKEELIQELVNMEVMENAYELVVNDYELKENVCELKENDVF
ncbi:MAG: hypothetical protein EZS28_007267 [Streblomastix strix]|uniref:Uncharacterized protein n=1 Tax=Streblomastix strix TaxID=222440 RepID=A0A5J4WS14_9EUKA|nr:MAG: hypothetical protein EZS28_007267 [Streblomastix strix]